MIILLINKCLWVTIKCIECKESFCKETGVGDKNYWKKEERKKKEIRTITSCTIPNNRK